MVDLEENRLPSFKMVANIEIPHPTGILKYIVEDLWFECDVWDNFIKDIRRKNTYEINRSATLQDMSNNFLLSISHQEKHIGRIALFLALTEPNTGMGEINIQYKKNIHIDEAHQIIREFLSAQKWWP